MLALNWEPEPNPLFLSLKDCKSLSGIIPFNNALYEKLPTLSSELNDESITLPSIS